MLTKSTAKHYFYNIFVISALSALATTSILKKCIREISCLRCTKAYAPPSLFFCILDVIGRR